MSSSRRASSLYVPPQRRSGVAETASGPSGLSSSARGGGAVQRSLEGEYALLASAPLSQEERRTQASLPATPTNFPDGSRDSPGLVSAAVRMSGCYSTPQQRAGGAGASGLQRSQPALEELNTVAIATAHNLRSSPHSEAVVDHLPLAPEHHVGNLTHESNIFTPRRESAPPSGERGLSSVNEWSVKLARQAVAVDILAVCALRNWWSTWTARVLSGRVSSALTTWHLRARLARMRVSLTAWHERAHRKNQVQRKKQDFAGHASSRLASRLLSAWREEQRRVKEITLEITACNIARSEFYVRKCMKAWKATVDFASKCTTFAVQREQHVKREVLHEWSALTDTPDVTPKQWATLRRHLRRLCGQEDSIAAITWEVQLRTKSGEQRVIPSRGLLLSHVTSASHHCHHLHSARPLVTTIPANRPARLVRLGVSVEEVIKTLRRTTTLGASVQQHGVQSVPSRNPYGVLSSEDDSTIDEEDVHSADSAPQPPRSKASSAPRPTQRERAVRVQALTELAHEKEVAKQERKRQKLAKRKLAKARRRSDEGRLMYDSTSTSSEEKSTLSSCQTSSTEALSSDASHTSSSRSSRQKGGRQRRRQAQATRHERQLRELQEESERVALDAATAHQAQLTALRMDMHNAVEEATRMQQELRTKVCQEARQAALESAEEQIARMQHAADAVSHQHEQAVASQAEEAARHHQQLREMQRAAEEQRQQLDQAARDQRLLEQQVAESKMVVQAALEAADGRAHSRPGQPPNTPASYATVTSDAQEAEHEALMVPPSATTVDVRGHKGVTFEEDASTRASSPTSVHDRLAKVDWRSISAPAAVAIRARVEERLGGHAGNLEAERMFFDVARKYRDHDLASGSGPPISEAPASQLPRPPHLGTAVIQSVHDEVASSTTNIPCSRCSRSPQPPVAIWSCDVMTLSNMSVAAQLVPLCIYCTRGVWPGAFDQFPTVSPKPLSTIVGGGGGGDGGDDDDDDDQGGPGGHQGGGNGPPNEPNPDEHGDRPSRDPGGSNARRGGSGGGGDDDPDDEMTLYSFGSSRRSSYNDGRQQREEYTRHSYALKAAKDIMSLYSAPLEGSTNPFGPLLRFVDEFDRCLALPVVLLAMNTPCNVPNGAFELGEPILSVHILLKEITQHCFPTPSSEGTELRGVLLDAEADKSLNLEKVIVPLAKLIVPLKSEMATLGSFLRRVRQTQGRMATPRKVREFWDGLHLAHRVVTMLATHELTTPVPESDLLDVFLSGLSAEVRKEAFEIAERKGTPLILLDRALPASRRLALEYAIEAELHLNNATSRRAPVQLLAAVEVSEELLALAEDRPAGATPTGQRLGSPEYTGCRLCQSKEHYARECPQAALRKKEWAKALLAETLDMVMHEVETDEYCDVLNAVLPKELMDFAAEDSLELGVPSKSQ
ncbi:hypothetical protein CYMTET_5969 [Cymbomonas tetramitiformis]|uniref:Uncharacterized protein n=2 Tax=Cymbomonas tetramitiformis TaxID=36881 RepID=A0AAE0GYC2_9CHLO|nr:hypothetical protein CYMTET_5969 [Cymbomonas tetramitiformis]